MFGEVWVWKFVILSAYLLLHLSCVSSEGYLTPDAYDTTVLILGAGTAGMQAARTLLASNFTEFIVLEGSDKTGGVVRKINFGELELASGNMWAYPDAQGIEELDTLGIEVKKVNYDSYVIRNDYGEDLTDDASQRYDDLETAAEATDNIAEMVLNGKRLDVSQKVALAMSGWVATTPLDRILEWMEFDFAEGIQSKHMSLFGPYNQEEIGGDYEHIITNPSQGFFPDVEAQLPSSQLKFNKIIENIDQSGDKVVVTAEGNKQYTADYVLVTFSIGVLQHGGVTFTPELPAWKTEQIFRYQRGTIDPIFLRFSNNFWGDKEWIFHASDRNDIDRHYYPGFLNLEADGFYPSSKMLVGFVTGEEAIRVESLTDEEVQEEVLGVLRAMFGEDSVSDLEEFRFERWASDPFHYGLFSTWPVPANIPTDAQQRLSAKVGRVFFAQDASDGNIGTIHGSIGASNVALEQIEACIRGYDCSDYEPVMDEMEDDDRLYGCVRLLKKEGKTRKMMPPQPESEGDVIIDN